MAALLCLAISAHAQFGEAHLNGLHINARYVFLTGDTRNSDCTVSLELWGRKLAKDVQIAPVRLVRATDEANQTLPPSKEAFPVRSGAWQSVVLKGVSHATKSLILEGELELLTPATPYPVFTNFMQHLGEVLQHRLLEQNGIKITCAHLEGSPRTDFQIRVEDPQKKFHGIEFQWADGSEVGVIKSKGSSSFDSNAATFVYSYPEITPKNSNLKVWVDVAKNSEKIPFKIAIRPPWVIPTDLQVKIVKIDAARDRKTNTYSYQTRLAFAGAPLSNTVAVGKIQITKAQSDTGASFEIKTNDYWWFHHFVRCGPFGSSDSGIASITVPLHIQPTQASAIRVLEGNADLFQPSIANRGIVKLTNVFAVPGKVINDPVLRENGVRFSYMGLDNFRAKTNEWHNSSKGWIFSGDNYAAPADVKDSLLFSIEDSQQRVIHLPSWIAFLDEKGAETISPRTVMISSHFYLFTFGTIPKISGVRLYVVTPESLERVHFKVENVPLP